MPGLFHRLFRRQSQPIPTTSFADFIRRHTMEVPASEGAKDRLLDKRLLTFGDDDVVEVYAGDIRAALVAARNSTEPHPDRFRLEFDWQTGKLTATDGRAHVQHVADGGLLTVANFILSRIREEHRRPTVLRGEVDSYARNGDRPVYDR